MSFMEKYRMPILFICLLIMGGFGVWSMVAGLFSGPAAEDQMAGSFRLPGGEVVTLTERDLYQLVRAYAPAIRTAQGGEDRRTLAERAFERYVSLRTAAAMGIRVSDAELSNFMRESGWSQIARNAEGRYDERQYRLTIARMGYDSIADFEATLRETLIISKLRQSLDAAEEPTLEAMYERYRKDHRRHKVAWVGFDPDAHKVDLDLSKEEDQKTLAAWYDDASIAAVSQFRERLRRETGPRADVQVIYARFNDLTTEELRRRYDETWKALAEKEGLRADEGVIANLKDRWTAFRETGYAHLEGAVKAAVETAPSPGDLPTEFDLVKERLVQEALCIRLMEAAWREVARDKDPLTLAAAAGKYGFGHKRLEGAGHDAITNFDAAPGGDQARWLLNPAHGVVDGGVLAGEEMPAEMRIAGKGPVDQAGLQTSVWRLVKRYPGDAPGRETGDVEVMYVTFRGVSMADFDRLFRERYAPMAEKLGLRVGDADMAVLRKRWETFRPEDGSSRQYQYLAGEIAERAEAARRDRDARAGDTTTRPAAADGFDVVRERLIIEWTVLKLMEKAHEAVTRATDPMTFTDAAALYGFRAVTLQGKTKDELTKHTDFPSDPAQITTLFQLDAGRILDGVSPEGLARGPMDNPGVQCSVWKLLEKKPEEVPPLKDVRDRVEVEYESWVGMDRAKKGGEAFEKAMDEFCDAKIGDAVPKAAESRDQAIATATEKLRQEVADFETRIKDAPEAEKAGLEAEKRARQDQIRVIEESERIKADRALAELRKPHRGEAFDAVAAKLGVPVTVEGFFRRGGGVPPAAADPFGKRARFHVRNQHPDVTLETFKDGDVAPLRSNPQLRVHVIAKLIGRKDPEPRDMFLRGHQAAQIVSQLNPNPNLRRQGRAPETAWPYALLRESSGFALDAPYVERLRKEEEEDRARRAREAEAERLQRQKELERARPVESAPSGPVAPR